MKKTEIKNLIKKQKSNYTLDQQFYTNDDIFDLDLKNIFYNQWVFVGHISRIPNLGDYFLFNIGNESIIIIRGANNKIYAHYNVCRHRGSHICLEEQGLHNLLWHPVKGFRGDKVARFRGIMGLFEQHKIRFNKYRKFHAFTDEIVNFGVSSHDDCVDALVWLCNGLMSRGKLELEY